MQSINLGLPITIFVVIVLSYYFKKSQLNLTRLKYMVITTIIGVAVALFTTLSLGIAIYGLENISLTMLPEFIGSNLVIGLIIGFITWKPQSKDASN